MKITYDESGSFVKKIKICCHDMEYSVFTAKNVDIVGTIVFVSPEHQEFGTDKLNIDSCPFCGAEIKIKIVNQII